MTGAKPGGEGASTAAVLAFLWGRTVRNAVRTKLGRLREPRYLFGGLVALAWLATVLTGGGRGPAMQGRTPRKAEVFAVLEPAGAFALAALVALWWLFSRGRASLAMSEAEVQFLFPAPLPRAAILHYVVLKLEVGILASATLLTLVMARTALPSALRALPSFFLLIATIQLHHHGLSLRRAAWAEAPAGRRLLLWVGSRGAAVALLAVLVYLGGGAVQAMTNADSLEAAGPAALGALDASRLGLVLWPFRAAVAPLFARDAAGFLQALPAAAAIFLLHHFWVVRAQVRYEDATAELAARRARDRERRRDGRLAPLPSERRRGVQPFSLEKVGLPEAALVWKGLLGAARVRMRTLAAGAIAAAAAAFGGARAAAVWSPMSEPLAHGIAMAVATIGLFLGVLILPINLRLDFRRDLLNAPALKQWPVPPWRLALGELAAPLLISAAFVWTALAVAVALMAGAGAPQQLPLWERQVPLALSAALLAPGVAALVLVVQNGLTLAFPMWFPPSATPARGFAASGTNLISFLATMALLAAGLVPGVILAALLVALLHPLLGFWVAPVAATAALVPLAAEVAGGVFFLGRLFERFDPSLDLEPA